jgi:hypothetical protein
MAAAIGSSSGPSLNALHAQEPAQELKLLCPILILNLLLHQMASVAELEAGMISDRTRKALAASKKKLGGFRGRAVTAEEAAKGRKARSAKAAGHASSFAPIIARLDPNGSLSLRALAAALIAEGVPTPAGKEGWTAATVQRVKAKLAA